MKISTATPDGRSMSMSLGAIMGALEINTEHGNWRTDAQLLMQAMQTIILMEIGDELDKIANELHRASYR